MFKRYSVLIGKDLTYEEKLVAILDQDFRRLKKKKICSIKVNEIIIRIQSHLKTEKEIWDK